MRRYIDKLRDILGHDGFPSIIHILRIPKIPGAVRNPGQQKCGRVFTYTATWTVRRYPNQTNNFKIMNETNT